MPNSFIENVNILSSKIEFIVSLSENINSISFTEPQLNSIVEVKNSLSDILQLIEKEESISLKHEEVLEKAELVISNFSEIEEIKEQFDIKYEDFLAKVDEIKNLTIELNVIDENEDASKNYDSSTGVLTLNIPRGATGDTGDSLSPDNYGLSSERSAYDDIEKGNSFFALDTSLLYFKLSSESGDWGSSISFGKGKDGVGISNVEKTDSSNGLDTYTITMTNSDTYDFTVQNGISQMSNNVVLDDIVIAENTNMLLLNPMEFDTLEIGDNSCLTLI